MSKMPKQNKSKQRKVYRTSMDGTDYNGKKMDPKSETEPDMSLTIRELLYNHTRGVLVDVPAHEPIYLEDLEVPVIRDLTDLDNYRETLNSRLNELEEQLQNEKEEKMLSESIKAVQSSSTTTQVEKPLQKGSE
jgi:hypothetical protein